MGVMDEVELELYERIEAPKWVDFTTMIRKSGSLDDLNWFCLRAGCTQKHDEALDPAAIRANFLRRVMEARSPNVRAGDKLLTPRKIRKCPLTAPAKTTKPRCLNIHTKEQHHITAVPDKTPKSKFHAASTATALSKQEQADQKALTTPKRKKVNVHDDNFRSVQHPRKPATMKLSNEGVVKALSFQSPKKSDHVPPIRKVRVKTKKLEIATEMKENKSGHVCKSSRCAANDPNYSTPCSVPCSSRSCVKQDEKVHPCLKQKTAENMKHEDECSVLKPMVEISGKKIPCRQTNQVSVKDIADELFEKMLINSHSKQQAGQVDEDDDKENMAVSANNSTIPTKSSNSAKKSEQTLKMEKKLESSNLVSLGGRYERPKPTTPKPFRFRTDERSILREANLEKKLNHPICDLPITSEAAEAKSFLKRIIHAKPSSSSTKKEEPSKELLTRETRSVRRKWNIPASLDRRTCDAHETPDRKTRRLETPNREGDNSQGTRSRVLTPIVPRRLETPNHEGDNIQGTHSRSCSRSRVLLTPTVPRGPNFHELHMPKTCCGRKTTNKTS